jgi:hypothetical protein
MDHKQDVLKAVERLSETAAAISDHFNVPIEKVNEYLCEVMEEKKKEKEQAVKNIKGQSVSHIILDEIHDYENVVYEYECEECNNTYLSEDPEIRYCDSAQCLDKDIRIYKTIYNEE